MRNFLETTSVFARAAGDHLRYYSPTAKEMAPPQYAGKVESTCATMALDLMGVKLGDQADPREFARFTAVGICYSGQTTRYSIVLCRIRMNP